MTSYTKGKELLMTANLETYKDMLQQPWGRLMYDIIFAQLGHHQN